MNRAKLRIKSADDTKDETHWFHQFVVFNNHLHAVVSDENGEVFTVDLLKHIVYLEYPYE